MKPLSPEDPSAASAIAAIHNGESVYLRELLRMRPDLATARFGNTASENGLRTLLHYVTDWPGHYPNGEQMVAVLVEAGADVNARFEGRHSETPLHWAASSGDMLVLNALLDHGADIEAPGAVIGGGTPLADAAAFGQWDAARRLVERGAKTTLWQAAALGLIDRVRAHFAGTPLEPWAARGPLAGDVPPSEVTHAFWSACHGGQRETAQFLLDRGADINWLGYDNLTPLGAARRAGATDLVEWLIERGAK